MGRRSSLEALPKELQDALHRLIRDGRTIEEIREHLGALGAEVSKSATGRYVKSARESMERYKQASSVAGQWVAQLGENPSGDVGTLLAEMLKTVAFQMLVQVGDAVEEGGKGAPKPMDVMLLAKAIRDLEATSKANIERREKIERAALERQAKVADKEAKARGLSDDAWAAIRAKFLGIPKPGEGGATA